VEAILETAAGIVLAVLAIACFALLIWAAGQGGRAGVVTRRLGSRRTKLHT
jgi:hypothetical protein